MQERSRTSSSPSTSAVVVAGSVVGLGVVRSLGQQGVPVILASYRPRDVGRASRYARETVPVPDPAVDVDGFLEALRRLASRVPGALLVPASDASLAVVPRHGALLRGYGFVQAWADDGTVATFLDKGETFALCRRAGVPAPTTTIPAGPADVKEFSRSATFPAVLKPLVSHPYYAHFKRKWAAVRGPEEAMAEYERATRAGFEVLLQEYVPGDEQAGANYNAYFHEGRPLAEFTAAKTRNWPADTGSPCATVSHDLPEIVESGRRLLEAVGFSGYANVEFKRDDRDGVYKLIEVNARFNLSSMLSTRCGVNFPWLQYRHLVHDETPVPPGWREGVHWVDVTRDVRCVVHLRRRDGYPWSRVFEPYRSGPVCAVWSWRDPGPAAVRALWTARALAARAVPALLRSSPTSPRDQPPDE